jgi:hypothetical protein
MLLTTPIPEPRHETLTMGEINIPPDEQAALDAVEMRELNRLIDQALRSEQASGLHGLLRNCGPYVAGRLHAFETRLERHRAAKAARKREETRCDVWSAGSDLASAVDGMKRRLETERKDAELFVVDDLIGRPYRFSKVLSVRVNYRWRRSAEDAWVYGSITFTHEVDTRPDYTRPAPKRKPSAAKQEQELQHQLYLTWEHLTRGALYSVRDFFRNGGDGATIPDSFKARVDSHSRGLNNYSTQFWRQQP